MKEVSWGKLVGQIFEEGIRIASEIEREMVKQAEQAKATRPVEPKAPAPAQAKAPKEKSVVAGSLQEYTSSNLKFQGYEIIQDLLPNLIHVHEDGNPVAYVVFGDGGKVFVQPAVVDVQTKPMEASLNVERIKEEMFSALQAKCSNEIITKIALELTDAFVAESVAKEDVQAFDKLVQTLNSLLTIPQGVH